jgi:tRNA-splicing ligase RtcB
MVKRADFKQIDKYIFEIPPTYRPDMRVPARFYADWELLEKALDDKSLEQLVNTATLPGVKRYALAMPDIHQGYGFPIGGVVATELPDGVISPGGVGYDINCGVRLLATQLTGDEVRPYLADLATVLYQNYPSGVGQGGSIRLKAGEIDRIAEQGARWALKQGLPAKPTWSVPRSRAASRARMQPRSVIELKSAARARWEPWAQATISSKSIWSMRSLTSRERSAPGCFPAR